MLLLNELLLLLLSSNFRLGEDEVDLFTVMPSCIPSMSSSEEGELDEEDEEEVFPSVLFLFGLSKKEERIVGSVYCLLMGLDEE